ncbi:MAG: carboxymuconolactone decarboxylase family protein [Opitutales bacterium]|nr:carboxymuconolactone decarboxylase family protein [Opitutales bacterium]
MQFNQHSKETAPEASVPVLQQTEKAYGFALNLFGVLAESPAALSAYVQINGLLEEHSVLSAEERQVVMLTVSETNNCEYCVAAHCVVAEMSGLPEETIEKLRSGQAPSAPKQAALFHFAKSVNEHRGWVPETDQQAFLEAGFSTRHVLDVITILALKTLSNYTNHLAEPELDEAFAKRKWSKT